MSVCGEIGTGGGLEGHVCGEINCNLNQPRSWYSLACKGGCEVFISLCDGHGGGLSRAGVAWERRMKARMADRKSVV